LIRIQDVLIGAHFLAFFNFPVSEWDFLFVAPVWFRASLTVLDAHAALLTPPRWVEFLSGGPRAERHGKDRVL